MKKTMTHYDITKEITVKYGNSLNNTLGYLNAYISILSRENILNIELKEHKELCSDFVTEVEFAINFSSGKAGSSGVKNVCMRLYKELKSLNKKINYSNKQTYSDMTNYLLCKIENPNIVYGDKYFFKLINGDLDKELNLTKTIIIFKGSNENDLPIDNFDKNIVYYKRLYTHQRPEMLYREIRKAKDIFDNLKQEIYENSKI